MRMMDVKALQAKAFEVLDEVVRTCKPILITKDGIPIGYIQPIDEKAKAKAKKSKADQRKPTERLK
jgi:prevent-host-death family protein